MKKLLLIIMALALTSIPKFSMAKKGTMPCISMEDNNGNTTSYIYIVNKTGCKLQYALEGRPVRGIAPGTTVKETSGAHSHLYITNTCSGQTKYLDKGVIRNNGNITLNVETRDNELTLIADGSGRQNRGSNYPLICPGGPEPDHQEPIAP